MPPFLPFALLSLVFWIAVIGGGFALALRLIRALERRAGDPRELAELRDRLARLEDTIEGVNHQIERVTEAQEFTSRLLTERSETPPGE